tara:strand:+ start:173 stop:598 length:426 start_codon:yes stop_codon:yes gene_type:complete
MDNNLNLNIDEHTKQGSSINPNHAPLPREMSDIEDVIKDFLQSADYKNIELFYEGENKTVSDSFKFDLYIKNILSLVCSKIIDDNRDKSHLIKSIFDVIYKSIDCLKNLNVKVDPVTYLPLVIGYTLKTYKESLSTSTKKY